MTRITHLRSLQALELSIRLGSLKAAAEALSITPAAVGQRIRALENFLGTDLLLRGRSGLQPTTELTHALDDLRSAFAALERVSDTLDFQRVTEIHIVADPDWANLWLLPRLPDFREANPNILFCINGEGDVPMRLGAPDLRIEYGDSSKGEPLFTDRLIAVCSPDNLPRMGDFDPDHVMEGLPLLHIKSYLDDPLRPGWREWFEAYGLRRKGHDRGVLYSHMRVAMAAMRDDVGYLVCGLSLVASDLESGRAVRPFPADHFLDAPEAYRMRIRDHAADRPQLRRFLDWLQAEASDTASMISNIASGKVRGPRSLEKHADPSAFTLSAGS